MVEYIGLKELAENDINKAYRILETARHQVMAYLVDSSKIDKKSLVIIVNQSEKIAEMGSFLKKSLNSQ